MLRILLWPVLLPYHLVRSWQVGRLERVIRTEVLDVGKETHRCIMAIHALKKFKTPASARAVIRLTADPEISANIRWPWEQFSNDWSAAIPLLRSADELVVRSAAEMLPWSCKAAIPVILRQIRSGRRSTELCEFLWQRLASFPAEDRAAAADFIPLLRSADERIARHAAELLSRETKSALPAILQQIRSGKRSTELCDSLWLQLARFPAKELAVATDLEKELRPLLKHPSQQVQEMAVRTMAVKGDRPSIERLIGCLRQSNYQAATTLSELVDVSHAPELWRIHAEMGDSYSLGLLKTIIERDAAIVPEEILFRITVRVTALKTETYKTVGRFTDVDRDMSTKSYEECFEEETCTVVICDNRDLIEKAKRELIRRGRDPAVILEEEQRRLGTWKEPPKVKESKPPAEINRNKTKSNKKPLPKRKPRPEPPL